jgi:signal transduction histidine kinase/ActR/RegA family two-component response regulator
VLDNRAAVVARYPGATNFTGQLATPDLQQLLRTKDEGLFHSTSLDGRPTTGYFSRAPMGWTFVAGLPETRFAGSLRNTMKPIFIGALLLLGLAVAGSLALARRIVEPVRSLKTAVLQLQNQQPVEIRATGLVECDEVTVALAEAEETIRHARADLESQVAHAVQRTQLTEKRAAQSQRVAAVGRLTGGVAHDFNNLLGVVSNSAHLIQRHPAAAELAAPLAAMQRAVESGSQLTQHLLRFSGRRAVRPQRLRPREVLPEMQDMLRSVLGRHVTVSVQVAADTQTIRVDASELELALINLALNARDAMPRGGELRLGARNADSRDLSSSPELAPGDYVLISVGDDGIGMDAGVIAHAFEPFFTTKATGQGGGLGLSQVHGFCVQAGGTARVDSTPGLGTTMVLLLPGVEGQMGSEDDTAAPRAAQVVCESTSAASAASATSEVSAAAAVSAVSPTPAPASAPTAVDITGAGVLLVEDNQALADTTEALLVAHGAQVTRADDALQALRLIETGAAFDVVLSDVMMPGATDGLALARYLRDLRPALPVILITALGQAVAGEEGEFKVLHKPCPQPELLAAVFQAINESHSSRAAARLKP